jgi:hypothetical protein
MRDIIMKKNKTLTILVLITIIACFTGIISSCEIPLALGERLNLNGPTVTIHEPQPRQPVDGKFFISGSITDDTGIDRVLIRASYNVDSVTIEFPMQWRYTGNRWEVSLDYGKVNTWTTAPSVTIKEGMDEEAVINPEWNGDIKNINFIIPIDMTLSGDGHLVDGQYQFSVTAWNLANNSDDNSLKTRNVILYKDPPLVNIISPVRYPKKQLDPDIFSGELVNLYTLEDYRDPAYIGKFINGEFLLQWQIEDKNEVWAIDIRFYETFDIDGDLIDPYDLKDDYIFKMTMNDINNLPVVPSPGQTLRPNGYMTVPDLTEISSGTFHNPSGYSVDYEVKKPVSGKTLLQIVIQCRNAAGLPLKEQPLECFVYWPEADIPWITFPEAMTDKWTIMIDGQEVLNNIYPVFPGSQVPVKAYDDDGVDSVSYSIYLVDGQGEKINEDNPVASKTIENPMRNTNFSWAFDPPETIASYIIEAKVIDIKGAYSVSSGYFQTRDISWPEIRPPDTPDSTKPLYQFINGTSVSDWSFNIKGIASDAKEITAIYMVWINPHSSNYSAMSQLSYFRDPDYPGWTGAEEFFKIDPDTAGPYYDGAYDPNDQTKHNKVWKLNKTDNPEYTGGINPLNRRYEAEYSKTLNLKNDLNIAPGEFNNGIPYDFLKSQVFVFKAIGHLPADPEQKPKTHIIVWSPEGASLAPGVEIKEVIIKRGAQETKLNMGVVEEIASFQENDEIIITGTWTEDSARYLDYNLCVTEFFEVTIGSVTIPKNNLLNTTFTIEQANPDDIRGTWTVTATVGGEGSGNHAIRLPHIRDTLMVNARITNIGGHSSEATNTWFVSTDYLRFMRIGSDLNVYDGYYKAGQTIKFFLEFTKPVKLKNGGNPELQLKAGASARAKYVTPVDGLASPRQFFEYTVGSTDSTQNEPISNPGELLNITNLVTSILPSAGDYPFIFEWEGSEFNEEVKLVNSDSDKGTPPEQYNVIPTTEGRNRLMDVKNFIIDTTAPTLNNITVSGRGGWYGSGNTIYLTASFSEDVYLGTDAPKLQLRITNGTNTESKETEAGQPSGSSMIFTYKIKDGDVTPGTDDLLITGFTGDVLDQAGNRYNNSGFASTAASFRTPKDSEGNGIRIKAIPLLVPTLEVFTCCMLNTCQITPGSTCTGIRASSGSTQGTSGALSGTWDPNGYKDLNGNPDIEAFDTDIPQWEKDFIDQRLDMAQRHPEHLKPVEMLLKML